MNNCPHCKAEIDCYIVYVTFRYGVPYPGYLECHVEAENSIDAEWEARSRVYKATKNTSACFYDDLAKVPEGYRIYRGQI